MQPRIIPNSPVLIVGPSDGFHHFTGEAAKLGLTITSLDSQATLERLLTRTRTVPAGLYYTTYTQLTRNGVKPPPKEFATNCGESKKYPHGKVKCIGEPTLSDLIAFTPPATLFECTIVDEGVRMKGGTTLMGTGIRQLQTRFRLVTTATPIKNRLPDVAFLASWACAADHTANARWPYTPDVKGQNDLAENYLIAERNLTREAAEKGKKKRRFRKLSAEVCNIHGLWKLLAPAILRRRKADMCDIPLKESHIIRVPMGKEQAAVYSYHLNARYKDKNGKAAHGAKLQALRIAAANPCSALLHQPRDPMRELREAPASASEPAPLGSFRSAKPFIPKLSACLNLIAQILARNEQVIIFSAFNDNLDALSDCLVQAGIQHLTLDGRTDPKARGRLADRFKQSKVPVLLAGLESMAEMHSFPQCNNAILLAYSWAWDKYEQGINRIHRINSPGLVHIWSLICDGTIDRVLDELRRQKGDSQELVLDGKLMHNKEDEINLAELIAIAEDEFDSNTKTIDEAALELEWPMLCNRLRTLAAGWSNQTGAHRVSPDGVKCIIPDPIIPAALEAFSSLASLPPVLPPPIIIPIPPIPPVHQPSVNPMREFLRRRLARAA